MARAHSIWIVHEGQAIGGAFTVKHELLRYLRSISTHHDMHDVEVRRVIDGHPEMHSDAFTVSSLLRESA
jgi:mannose-6-phosphate isomerase-like protein (cupin superfamily)